MLMNWGALIFEETCRQCGKLIPSSLSNNNLLLTLCPTCLLFIQINNNSVAFMDLEISSRSFLMPVIRATSYDGPTQRLIRRLKYDEDRLVARDLTKLMFSSFHAVVLNQNLIDCQSSFIITPVPLHKSKIRQRGYNQAGLLSLNLLKKVRHLRRSRCEELLERTKETSPMFGLNRKERFENVHMAFACNRFSPQYLKGKTIILVDDVFTSGATLKECARTLVLSGAESIIALTAAGGQDSIDLHPAL